MSKRQLNKAAPELLKVAKRAVELLQYAPLQDEAREELISDFRSAISNAEGHSEWKIRFDVTLKTWEHINLALDQWYVSRPARTTLRGMLQSGSRVTARRVYCELEVNIDALKVFRDLLRAYAPQGPSGRAFTRLSKQIDDEINCSPLELLAKAGL